MQTLLRRLKWNAVYSINVMNDKCLTLVELKVLNNYNWRFIPGLVPLLRVDEKVLDSHKLIVGDYKVLVRHFPSLAVFGPGTLPIRNFWVCGGRGAAHLNGDTCHLWLCDAVELRTFLLHLALDVRVVDDFAQGDAAEQRTQETFPPAAAVGTVEDRHAEVTGEVGPLSKHRVLHITSST